ncbi:2089_t:CDS:1, partial [Entrophospora sp. SA101]
FLFYLKPINGHVLQKYLPRQIKYASLSTSFTNTSRLESYQERCMDTQLKESDTYIINAKSKIKEERD